jgi:predicted anti-sigma-YlaC factor YlaD
MDCERVRDEFLSELVTGEDHACPEPVRRHLEGCEGCRTELGELHRVWAALGQLPEAEPGAEVATRLMRRVRRQVIREAVLTVGGWVPAVLAAVVGVTLSLGLAFVLPYPSLVSLCQEALRLSEDSVPPYLLAGTAYGVPLALGVWILRRHAVSGTVIRGVEASVLFLAILAPFVIAQCREFAPALRVAFVSGLGVGAVGSTLAGLGLVRRIPLTRASPR